MTWKTIAQRTYCLDEPVRHRTNAPNTLPPWIETGVYNLKGARNSVEDGRALMATRRVKREVMGATYITEELQFRVLV